MPVLNTQSAAGPASRTRWAATLPRQLVHKQAVSEVLLTSMHVTSPESAAVHAQWPAGNRFFRQADGNHYGINVVLESVRQACVALTHSMLGVALDDQFIMLGLASGVSPTALRVRSSPANVTAFAELTADEPVRTGRRIAWRFQLAQEDDVFGSGFGELIAMNPERYRSMRTKHRDEATRTLQQNVGDRTAQAIPDTWNRDRIVATSQDSRHVLLVDQHQPNYFDHPLDHVPGMLIIEGACDVARSAHENHLQQRALVVGAETRCRRFAELTARCELRRQSTNRIGDALDHRVEVTQFGVECATSDVRTESV